MFVFYLFFVCLFVGVVEDWALGVYPLADLLSISFRDGGMDVYRR